MKVFVSMLFLAASRCAVACVGILLWGPAPVMATDGERASDGAGTVASTSFALLPMRRTRSFQRSKNGYGNQYSHANSAIPLKAGTGQYRNVLVSWNTVTYAASNRLMIGGGIDLYSTINAARLSPVWTARVQYCGPLSQTVHLGGTVFYLDLPMPATTEDPQVTDEHGVAAAMAQFTWGNADNQVTLSGGLSKVGGVDELSPIFTGAAAVRAFANLQLITEHWVLVLEGDDLLAHSLAFRVVGDLLAVDAGLLYSERISERTFSWGMPFLAASLNF